jgi:putative PIN family toxin of toxin-antitoxin system
MKVVLDTNVFVSGIFWGGPPHKILELWASDKIQVLITKKILEEYFKTIQKIDSDKKVLLKWTAFVTENSVVLEDKNMVDICRDPGDNKFLNCAFVGKADYLISGDDDLLIFQQVGLVRILNPSRFLKVIR